MLNLPTEYFRYLPVSDRDVLWDFYVTGVGRSQVPPDSRYPRSVHPDLYHFAWDRGRVLPEYQVLYITRGEGLFESEPTGHRKLTAGNLLLLFPGVWHRYRPSSSVGWEEYWISYGGDYASRLVERQFFSPQEPILPVGMDETILHPYWSVIERVRREVAGYQQRIAADAMAILAAALAALRALPLDGRIGAAINQAKVMIEQRTEEIVDMKSLANSLHMSYAHFRRVFKHQTGLSPYQYHLQLRINRAREILHSTTLTVKQVALRLNFESPYHFSKIFKRKTGMSPTEWRGGSRQQSASALEVGFRKN